MGQELNSFKFEKQQAFEGIDLFEKNIQSRELILNCNNKGGTFKFEGFKAGTCH